MITDDKFWPRPMSACVSFNGIIKQTVCHLIFQTWWVHSVHSNVIAVRSLTLSVFSPVKMVLLKRNSLPPTPLVRTHGTLPTFFACLFDKVIHLHGRAFRLRFASIFSISSQQSPLLFNHHTHTLTHTWNAPHSLLFLWAHSHYLLFLEHQSLLLLWKSPVQFSYFFPEGFSDLLDSLRA